MSLSFDETRRLDEIAAAIRRHDPAFALALDYHHAQARRARRLAVAGLLAGIGVLAGLLGLASARGPISIGMLVGLYGIVTAVAAGRVLLRECGLRPLRADRPRR